MRPSGGVATGGMLVRVPSMEAAIRPLGLAWNTIRFVGMTEAIALPLGVALAFALVRTDAFGRRATLYVILLSLMVPLPLQATAWLGAIGSPGRAQFLGLAIRLEGMPGAAFIHAMAALPWVVLIAGLGLMSVEPELEESAMMDLPPSGVVRRVTLRRSIGLILAAALATALMTAGEMTVTDLLQLRTYAEEIYYQFQQRGGVRAATLVTAPQMIVLGTALFVMLRTVARVDPAKLAGARSAKPPWRLGIYRSAAGVVMLGFAYGVMLFPVYGLAWRAGRVSSGGGRPEWSIPGLGGTLARAWEDLVLPSYLMPSPLAGGASLAAAGALVTVLFAWGLVWAARDSAAWRAIAFACLVFGLALPAPAAGMALKLAYRDLFVVGRKALVYDTPAIIVLGYAARFVPYALMILWPAVRSMPEAFLDQARVDGYGLWGRAVRIGLPLHRSTIFAALGAVFVLCLGELPVTILVRPPAVETVSSLLWALLHTGVESRLAGIGLILFLILAATGGLVLIVAWARLRLSRSS